MDTNFVLTILALILGFYMAWNIGANDVSNAMGTSVGSGALTMRRAVIIAAILEFSGAFVVGGNVSQTIQSGIINPDVFMGEPTILILGMLAALLGTGLWLQVASYFGWPVSTTHAIVGSILGFGLIIGGPASVHWNEVGSIALSWIISPVLSGIIAFMIFNLLQRTILFAMNPLKATKTVAPYLIAIVLFTFTLSLIFNGLSNLDFDITFPKALLISLLIALLGFCISFLLIKRIRISDKTPYASATQPHQVISLDKALIHLQRVYLTSKQEAKGEISHIIDRVTSIAQNIREETHFGEESSEYKTVEKLFCYLQILTACFVAFAHGANDVANAIGPVAAIFDILKNGCVQSLTCIPLWLLALGGAGIVVGLATWGWRVIETIGKKITELTPTRGFSAEFGAATTILIASKLGLPISTTHCLVGAVFGVGLARGLSALNLNTIRGILVSWVVTIPSSAIACIALFYLLKAIFI